ncbi:MAG: hypothetical protein M0P55_15380 [Clostridiales bacterium]|nr:hypothetical protein [Clostridiales bacterium]
MTELTIDKQFAGLCPALTAEEGDLLESSLVDEGCNEPITVWANHDSIILDGHNRYRICRRENLPFKTRAIRLETRADAVNWIIARQLGRRNLTDEQKAYLRGQRYNSEKRQDGGHGDQKSGGHFVPPIRKSCAEKLAEEYFVNPKTIKRDGQFAESVDAIAETVGEEAKAKILSGKSPLTKSCVLQAAKLPPKKMKQAVATGKMPKAEKPPPSGRQKVPHQQFAKLESDIGACLRLADVLHKSTPAAKFHRDVVSHLKNAIQSLGEWRKAVR